MKEILEGIAQNLVIRKATLATAESCTGGGIAKALTSIAGSSAWYQGGVVSYSNSLKQNLLGVTAETLKNHGAVSEQVAREMAEGAARIANSNFAVSTTGIAGPDGGSADKPVGTVCFGFFYEGETLAETKIFSGDRAQVREATIDYALTRLMELITLKKNG
jgi:nicotinamide-nucleotide amidase